MTHSFPPIPDPEKIEKAIQDFGTNTADILESISARHGQNYALQVGAIAGIVCTLRTANAMVCEKFPPEFVLLAQASQVKCISELIDSLFPVAPVRGLPFAEIAAIVDVRRAKITEFEKNVDSIVKQRTAAETQLGVTMIGNPGKPF